MSDKTRHVLTVLTLILALGLYGCVALITHPVWPVVVIMIALVPVLVFGLGVMAFIPVFIAYDAIFRAFGGKAL